MRNLIFFLYALLSIRLFCFSGSVVSLMSLAPIMSAVLILFCILCLYYAKKMPYYGMFCSLVVILGFIWSFYSSTLTNGQINNLVIAMRYVLLVLVLIVAHNGAKPEARLLLSGAQMVSLQAISMYTLVVLGFLLIEPRVIQGDVRYQFPFSNPNTLGMFLTTLSILILASGKKIQYYWAHLVMINIICVFTGSLTNLAAIMCVNYCFVGRATKSRMLTISLLVIVFSLILFVILNTSIIDRVTRTIFTVDFTQLESSGSSLAWRVLTWIKYLEFMSFVDWIFGHGLGVSRIWFTPGFAGNSVYQVQDIPGTHNDFLSLLFDFGILGLVLLLYFLKIIGVTKKGERWIMLPLFLVMFFDNLFDSIIFINFVFLYILIRKPQR